MRAWKRQGRGERARYVAVLDRPEASVLRGLMRQIDDMLGDRSQAAGEPDELAALTGIRTGPSARPEDPVLARLLPDFHRPEPGPPPPGAAPEGASEDASEGADGGGGDGGGVDDDLSPALRSVREPELIAAKRSAIATVLTTCPESGGRVELATPEAEAWLAAVNDVRLALGTALEVSEDMPEALPDGDPRADHMPVYHWLTWLQDSLVTVLTR